MVTEVPPMVDNKVNAGPDWFFCDGCLAYHAPEYRGEFQSNYKKYCHFALAVIREEEKPVDDIPLSSISHAQDIDEKAVTLSSPIDSTLDNNSETVNVTRQQRSLRKDLPEEEIIKSTESGQVLAERYGVTRMTISRIRRGQRVLI